jgi:hypothetical protein
VLIDSPYLQTASEPNVFAPYFDGADRQRNTVVVPNLGRTAELVVPKGIVAHSAYAHLAVFLRDAPATQVDALWRCVAETALAALHAEPLWVSTAGAGVAWLHVRIERTPKYYAHRPYVSVST